MKARVARLLWVCGTTLAIGVLIAPAPRHLLAHSENPPAKPRLTAAASSRFLASQSAARADSGSALPAVPRQVLDKYCVPCHNERLKTAGLMLDNLDPARVGERPEIWEKVARKLRTREMPPPGRDRPDADTYVATAAWLENALDQAAALRPNPGRVAVHRLNRSEYANAVRDLLGLDVDVRSMLAEDEPDHQSFD